MLLLLVAWLLLRTTAAPNGGLGHEGHAGAYRDIAKCADVLVMLVEHEEEEQQAEASGRGPASTQLLCLPHVGTLIVLLSGFERTVDCGMYNTWYMLLVYSVQQMPG